MDLFIDFVICIVWADIDVKTETKIERNKVISAYFRIEEPN